MPPLRVAIVGAGSMGHWHARYALRAGARLSAVVDPDANATSALSRVSRGVAKYAELQTCLDSLPVDVVHVCTGVDSHVPLAEAALLAGKHVLVEKPVAASVEGVERLVELARARQLELAVTHQMPFQRGFRRLQQRQAELGELVEIVYRAHTAGGDGSSAERRRALLLEILPHPVSLLRGLGQDVAPTAWDVLDSTDDDLRLTASSGPVRLGINMSLRARPTRNELLVAGTRATTHVDLFHGYAVFDAWGTSRLAKVSGPLRRGSGMVLAAASNRAGRLARREPAYPGLLELIGRFYDAVLRQRESPISAQEMLQAAAVADRIRSLASRG